MRKGFAPVIIIFAFLLAAGIAAGFFYLGKNWNQNRIEIPKSAGSIQTNSPNTVGWKTYTNTFYKFKISYPSDWTGPFRVSGTMEQGHVSFEGKEGVVNLDTGGGFGGGPCPKDRLKITTKIGVLGFCLNQNADNIEQIHMANDYPIPSGFLAIGVSASINPPKNVNESVINEIISTIEFIK